MSEVVYGAPGGRSNAVSVERAEAVHTDMVRTGDPRQLRQPLDAARCAGRSIGLVPTMGYLHQGHLGLIEAARAQNDLVVLSIYVNPSQFGPREDLARYPRSPERDAALAAGSGVDILFSPTDAVMYPTGVHGQQVWVDPGTLAAHLCGARRPGHFRGVATIVVKLLNMVRPDRAYFGQKDAQQALIVSRLVRDLAAPCEVRILPTVREPDGLALSSRNVNLSVAQRAQAPALHRALQLALSAYGSGEREAAHLLRLVEYEVGRSAPDGRLEYAEVADAATLSPIEGRVEREALLALAAWFGGTRLIDNVTLSPRDAWAADAEAAPS